MFVTAEQHGASRMTVYLDGIKLDDCLAANDDLGFAIVALRDYEGHVLPNCSPRRPAAILLRDYEGPVYNGIAVELIKGSVRIECL